MCESLDNVLVTVEAPLGWARTRHWISSCTCRVASMWQAIVLITYEARSRTIYSKVYGCRMPHAQIKPGPPSSKHNHTVYGARLATIAGKPCHLLNIGKAMQLINCLHHRAHWMSRNTMLSQTPTTSV